MCIYERWTNPRERERVALNKGDDRYSGVMKKISHIYNQTKRLFFKYKKITNQFHLSNYCVNCRNLTT